MGDVVYFDLEADGLYDDVTTVWCIGHSCNGDIEVFHGNYEETYHFLDNILYKAKILCGHNIINYDLPVLRKLFGIQYKGEVLDTWLLSRMLCPDRVSHSLKAWGNTLGFDKGDHTDFTKLSEDMIRYCARDVAVTKKVCEELNRRIAKYD